MNGIITESGIKVAFKVEHGGIMFTLSVLNIKWSCNQIATDSVLLLCVMELNTGF